MKASIDITKEILKSNPELCTEEGTGAFLNYVLKHIYKGVAN